MIDEVNDLFTDGFRLYPGPEQQICVSVTKVVQDYLGQSRLPKQIQPTRFPRSTG
jgi:hypothetical protein